MIPSCENIGNALKRREFRLLYQPIYEVLTNKIVGMEVLLRWHYGQRNLYMNPESFIPYAEKTGIITEITLYITKEVCRFIKECEEKLGYCVPVSINFSRIDLCNPFFIRLFMDILQMNGVDPCYIEAEITETAFCSSRAAMLFQIKKLRQNGIKIAIDDFGSGYSSLSCLKSMPIDILKIDRLFVQDITNDNQGQAILKSILSLANTLGLETIIEGVETKEEAEYVKAQGCNMAQGFYFCKPISESEILEKLREKSLI